MPRKKKESAETEAPAIIKSAAPVSAANNRKPRSTAAGSARKTPTRKKAAPAEAMQQSQAVEQAPVQVQQEAVSAFEDQPTDAVNQDSMPGISVSEYEQVALLAYSLWAERGYQGGSPEDDWFRAEQEVRRRSSGNYSN
jgi:hypothetical protein